MSNDLVLRELLAAEGAPNIGGHPHWKLFLVDPLSKRALPVLKPPGRDKVLNTYSWPFPKFNALLKSINTWWNGHHHFTQPRFPLTVTPKMINWKTIRINHFNISFMGGIYYNILDENIMRNENDKRTHSSALNNYWQNLCFLPQGSHQKESGEP